MWVTKKSRKVICMPFLLSYGKSKQHNKDMVIIFYHRLFWYCVIILSRRSIWIHITSWTQLLERHAVIRKPNQSPFNISWPRPCVRCINTRSPLNQNLLVGQTVDFTSAAPWPLCPALHQLLYYVCSHGRIQVCSRL